MFEAVYKIVALVESNGQAERLFKVYEQGASTKEAEFKTLISNVYQQEVYRTLQAGDSLTITMQLDVPSREIVRTVSFGEDKKFAGDGLQPSTPDLLPTLSSMYEEFSQQVVPGDVFRITFDVLRS
jgi:hypothetical protein